MSKPSELVLSVGGFCSLTGRPMVYAHIADEQVATASEHIATLEARVRELEGALQRIDTEAGVFGGGFAQWVMEEARTALAPSVQTSSGGEK